MTIPPEKRFPALQVDGSTSLPVEGVQSLGRFLKAQIRDSAVCHPAMTASQIASVRDRQSADKRGVFLEDAPVEYVAEAVCDMSHETASPEGQSSTGGLPGIQDLIYQREKSIWINRFGECEIGS